MGAGDIFVAQHQPTYSAHRCRCGWEGDVFTVHVLDMLTTLPTEFRMEAMGMERRRLTDQSVQVRTVDGAWVNEIRDAWVMKADA